MEKQPKESRFSRFYTWAKPYSGRIIWILAGIITAVLFLTIGFWRTILIVILALIGYALSLIHISSLGIYLVNRKVGR